jgi:hypothetical protein
VYFCNILRMYGTLADAEEFIRKAHARGIRVIVDLVPNHSSDQHRFFQAALSTPPGSPEWARYHCVRGAGADGELPPNNWQSFFGGPAWSRIPWPVQLRGPDVAGTQSKQQAAPASQRPQSAKSAAAADTKAPLSSPAKAAHCSSSAAGSYIDDAVILAALKQDKALWPRGNSPSPAASPDDKAKRSAAAANRLPPAQPPPHALSRSARSSHSPPPPEAAAPPSPPPPEAAAPPSLPPAHAPVSSAPCHYACADPNGWWYLHLFDKSQPDFNWDSADVAAEFEHTMKFWLQRGVDGFRIDVAPGLLKAKGYPDNPSGMSAARLLPLLKQLLPLAGDALPDHDMRHFDQPEVHDIYRKWRRFIDE